MKPTNKKHYPNWRPFEEARKFARQLNLKDIAAWTAWSKSGTKPEDIPANPWGVYKGKGWINWRDWLGTQKRSRWRPFEEARQFARGLGLKNANEWAEWYKTNERPKDIPAAPARDYRDKGWISWGDWLGHEKVHKKVFKSFTEARSFARNLKLNGVKEWNSWAKSDSRPDDIPFSPARVYLEWAGWGDWLGNSNRRRYITGGFLPFEEARVFVRNLKLQNQLDYREWAKDRASVNDLKTFLCTFSCPNQSPQLIQPLSR